jgi:PAS domain S-box-containing protein
MADTVNGTLLLRDGSPELPIEFSGAPIYDVRGRVSGMVIIFRDVTERRRNEREMRRTTNILTGVLNGAADPIFVKDREGRFQYVNQILAQNTGLDASQVIGKRNTDFVSSDTARAADEIDSRIIRTGQPEITLDKFKIEGEIREFQTVRSPYRDGDGNIAGIIGISRDMTERQRAEAALRASEQRYRQIVETAREGIWLVDDQSLTVFTNKACADMLGYSVDEMKGRSLFDFVFDEDRPLVEQRIELRREGHAQQVDSRLRRKDGSELWTLASSSPVRDAGGQVTGALVMLTDLTERKKAEGEREQLLFSEQFARAQAEAHAERLAILASGSRVLTSSLDVESTLTQFARLIVPRQADVCAVCLLMPDGRLNPLALALADERKLDYLTQMWQRYPLSPERIPAVQDAIQTRTKQIAGQLPADFFGPIASDDRHLQMFESLNFQSYMVVPLIARERVLGVIILVYAESGRHFGAEDAAFVEEQAQRAALAIDNASLYREAQVLNAQLELRVAERTMQLQAASAELRRLSAHLEGTREQERARIARELHDQLAQEQTAAKINVSQISKKVERGADDGVVIKELNSVVTALDDSVESIRTIVAELRPDLLEHFGLQAAIEEQVRDFQQRTGLEGQLTTDIVGLDWDQERSLALFRILQESLTNIAKHAQATRVDISLKADLEQDKLRLQVRDNGRGINPDEMNKLNRFGLIGMRERVTLLGGTIEIHGIPGDGTVVNVSVPLELDGNHANGELKEIRVNK